MDSNNNVIGNNISKYLSFIFRAIKYLLFIALKIMKWAILLVVLIVITVGAVVATDVVSELNKLYTEASIDIKTKNISEVNNIQPSYIYDKGGNLIIKITTGEESRHINYRDIPKNVVNAMIAVEDRNFNYHCGVDLKGIIRVIYNYGKSDGNDVAGASTITQQLMRNSYITKEVTLERKLKEICYSLAYEELYSKNNIMENYINNIYFGNNFYGIESASYGYYGKSVVECSLSEIAYLCALPNRPNYYNPYVDSSRAISRRDKILVDMLECGYITYDEYNEAIGENMEIIKPIEDEVKNDFTTAFSSYSTYCAVEKLMEIYGFNFEYKWGSMEDYKDYRNRYEDSYEENLGRLKTGGYKIYTSLDSDIQYIIQSALDEKLREIDNTIGENGIYELQGSITCIDNETGLVVGILSGREQNEIDTYLNRGYQGYRQPGSSIKPLIVYLPAMSNGYGSNSTIKNIDIDAFKKDGTIVGNDYTLENAVEWSRNGCAYYLLNLIGVDTGLSYLEKMKFNRIVPDDYYLSASLGGLTYGTTTSEMASAYNCIYNNGVYYDDSCLVRIDKGEQTIYSYENRNGVQVYNSQACINMVGILEKVIKSGTARGMNWDEDLCEAAGKTGTTNDNKDGWFVGMTPYYSMAVWVGYDTPKKLSTLQGGTYPASIWKVAMEDVVKHKLEDSESYKTWNGLDIIDVSDSGNSDNTEVSDNEYSWLEGRNDNELLSEGYTVGDYKRDHELEKRAISIIDELRISYSGARMSDLINIVSSIKSKTMRNNLNEIINSITHNGVSSNGY